MINFVGKNVVVTGGTGGIGKACVDGVVKGGGTAIILDMNKEAGAELEKLYGEGKAKFYEYDQGDTDDVARVFEEIISDFGQIHSLINNAGIISTGSIEDVTLEKWKKVMDINLTGVYACIRSTYKNMAEHGGGRIVNVASIAAKVGGGLLGTIAYASAKGGVISLTKAVAKECGPSNIGCVCVNPGAIISPMTDHMEKERYEMIRSGVPFGRWGTAEECANVILFYASDLASFTNGDIVECDGGITKD